MINGFFHTIQRDLIDVARAIKNDAPRNEEQNQRVTLSAMRIFASGIMGMGALTAISTLSFFATAPVSAVLTATIGVGLYALGHDVFLLAKRCQALQNPINNLENGARGFVRDVGNFFTGNQAGNGHVEEFTNETFFQPLWVQLLSRQA